MPSTGFWLNMLNKSTIALSLLWPMGIRFSRRRFVWLIRAVKYVLGGARSTRTVPLVPAARVRPSDGALRALVATKLGLFATPGRLWTVALVCRPHHGNGYTAKNLTYVCNGGLMSQNAGRLGDEIPAALPANPLTVPPIPWVISPADKFG